MIKEIYLKYTIIVLLLLVTLQTCGTKSRIKGAEKDIELLSAKIDSLTFNVQLLPTANDVRIEGLKNENHSPYV